MRHAVVALLIATSLPALADEFDGKHALSTDERAKIEMEQDKAHADIEKRYAGDNSSSARSAKMREEAAADRDVLSKHGTSDRDIYHQDANTNSDGRKAIASRKSELKAKEEKEAKAKTEGNKGSEEGQVEVIKGYDEDHPVPLGEPGAGGEKKKPALDENGNPVVSIEKGFTDEEMAAKGGGGGGEGGSKSDTPKDTEIAVPPSVEPGTEVIQAPSSP